MPRPLLPFDLVRSKTDPTMRRSPRRPAPAGAGRRGSRFNAAASLDFRGAADLSQVVSDVQAELGITAIV